MIKLILILFFALTLNAQTKVVLYSHLEDEEHTALVWQSFIEGYGSGFDTNNLYQIISNTITTQDVIDSVHSIGAKVFIFPYTGAMAIRNYIETDSNQTINFLFVMPAGSNTYEQIFTNTIPSYMILCGATDSTLKNVNVTGYNISFHTICTQQLSSFASGKIAGMVTRILDCGNSITQTKNILIANRSYSNENGYGIAFFRNSKILVK